MRRAFVMGSNGPADLSPLRFARDDAEKMKTRLSGRIAGFDVIMPEAGADVWAIRQLLSQSVEACDPGDTFVCYFSGHGLLEKGSLFLMWDNSRLDKLLTTTLSATEIVQAMQQCKASSKLLILDCCHAGAAVASLGLKDAISTPVEELLKSSDSTSDNHLVLMASGRLEKARELSDLGGSFLTSYLCSAMEESFFAADKDRDQVLSIQDLMAWLETQANAHNRMFPKSRVPIPYLFGQQKGEFILGEMRWIPYEIQWPFEITMVVLPIHYNENVMCLSKHPITNAQYKAYIESNNRFSEPEGEDFRDIGDVEQLGKHSGSNAYRKWQGPFHPWGEEGFCELDKPVVCVSLDDAKSYCVWLEREVRKILMDQNATVPRELVKSQFARTPMVWIPQEKFWDFAAFGTYYPSYKPETWLSETAKIHHKTTFPASIDTEGSRTNARGLADMVGNVWEWCVDNAEDSRLHAPSLIGQIASVIHIAHSQNRHLKGTPMRGGSFLDDLTKVKPFFNSYQLEYGTNTRHSDLGFRIAGIISAQSLPKEVQSQIWMYPSANLF